MYQEFFKLNAKPFRLSPDPRFLFHSAGHSKALAYLRYGLQQGEGFIVITGNVGTGKTTLARLILSQVDQKKVIPVQLVTTQLEADDLLRMVSASLGLAHQGLQKSTLLRNMQGYLMARAREGKRVLLLIDEAQNLPRSALEELRMLSNFQAGERALLQSFLLGQGEFHELLGLPGLEQFRQRIVASYHLQPLTAAEMRDYIEHRLKLCGWSNDPVFTDDAFAEIFDATSGVPRRVNLLAERVLLQCCIDERHAVDGAVVKTVAQEARAELAMQDDGETNQRRQTESELEISAEHNVEPLHPANTISNTERRLIALERKVAALEQTLSNERQRMRQVFALLTHPDDDNQRTDAYAVQRDKDKAEW